MNGSRLTGLTCSKAPGFWMVEHQLVQNIIESFLSLQETNHWNEEDQKIRLNHSENQTNCLNELKKINNFVNNRIFVVKIKCV